MELPPAPTARGGGESAQATASFMHQQISAQALGKRLSPPPALLLSCLQAATRRQCRLSTGMLLMELGPPWDTPWPVPACQRNQHPLEPLFTPRAPSPCPIPQVCAVSQGDGWFPHGAAASCTVAVEGKQPQRGLWTHLNFATSKTHTRGKPWNRSCCNESHVHSADKAGGTEQSLFAAGHFCINPV